MVFAPALQLTITVEERGGEADVHLHAGGQGVWQARMIKSLGVPVTLCTTLGGETGRVLEPLLADEGVDLRIVPVDSSNGVYVHDRRGGSRLDIAEQPGQPLSRHELDEFYGIALAEGLRAGVSLLGGPTHPRLMSPDVYRRLAHDLGRNGCAVIADLHGPHLSGVLAGGVRFVKVSDHELVADRRARSDGQEDLVGALLKLRDEGAHAAVVSRAEHPALTVLEDGVYEVVMPTLEVADPRGAGDSMTAGLAAVIAEGGDLPTAVRTGAAAGALNVTRHGLGTGQAGIIGRLLDRVDLVPLIEQPTRRVSPDELAARARKQ